MKKFALLSAGVLFFSYTCLGQSITTVTPSNVDVGQGLPVTIVAANDSLVSCSQIMSFGTVCNSTVSRVYFKNGDSLRIASAVSNVQRTSLVADMVFPLSCPTGAWDVAIEHTGGSTIWKTGGFTLNALSDPVIDSVRPTIVYQKRKITLTVIGTHTHFKIALQASLVNNVTAAWLLRDTCSIKADSVAPTNCISLRAYFTLKNSADTGLFDVKIDQGNGLPSATLSKALSIRGTPTSSYALPEGCIAYYPFEGDAVDYSDNGNNGAINGATWVDGVYGAALSFNGASDYVSVPNSESFTITDGLSLCAWVKPEEDRTWSRVLCKANAGNSGDDWIIGQAQSGGIYFSIYKSSSQFYTDGRAGLTLNEWNHIAGTWDGKCMRIYLNGVLQPESVSVSPPANSSTNPLYIGKRPTNSYYFKGAADEIMIFNRGLSAAEVDSIFQGIHLGKLQNDSTIPVIIPYNPKITLDTRPILKWHPVAKAKTYTLTIATNSGFSSVIAKIPLDDTTYTPSVSLPIGPVFWHVKSDIGSRWSLPDKIIIQSDTIPFLIRYNGSEVESLRPRFAWNKVTEASMYRIEMAINSSFTNLIMATPLTDTAYIPLANMSTGTCYWHVSCDRNISLYCAADSLVIKKPVTYGLERHASLPTAYSCIVKGRSKSGAFIQFGLPKASTMTLKMYSIQGKLLKEISHFYQPGYFQSPIDISGFPRGFYIVDFRAGGFTITKRISNLF